MQEKEAARRKNEEEAIKQKMYDEKYGLPLWWMEMIPHKTLSQKEYDRAMKKDKGFTVVDYKLPPRSKTKLDAVTEEENEGDDDNDAHKKQRRRECFLFWAKKNLLQRPLLIRRRTSQLYQINQKSRPLLRPKKFGCKLVCRIEEVCSSCNRCPMRFILTKDSIDYFIWYVTFV